MDIHWSSLCAFVIFMFILGWHEIDLNDRVAKLETAEYEREMKVNAFINSAPRARAVACVAQNCTFLPETTKE